MNEQSTDHILAEIESLNRTEDTGNGTFHLFSKGDRLVAVLSVAFLVFSLVVSYALYNYQKKHNSEITSTVSRAVVRELESDILELEKSLSRISSVHRSNPEMNRLMFWKLMREPIRDLKALQIIAWAPLVHAQGLERWIKSQQKTKKELLTYQTVRALRNLKPRYYSPTGEWQDKPVSAHANTLIQNWIAPVLLIEDEIGKVLNSVEHFKDGISEATKSGEIRASYTHKNAQGQLLSVLFSPVYTQQITPGRRRDLVREREKQIKGMLNFQFDIGAMLSNSFSSTENKKLGISVTEVQPNDSSQLLFQTTNGLFDDEHDAIEDVHFFGRTWRVRVHRDPPALILLLPPALAALIGLVMTAALHTWHRNNRRFKKKLSTMLAAQKREITKKTSLLEAVLEAAPVGIEYINEKGTPQLQNNLAKIGTASETALSAIKSGKAEPVEHQHTKDCTLQHYNLHLQEGERHEYFEIISQSIDDTSEMTLGSVIVCNNVTERETTNQKLEIYIQELESTNHELKELTHSATHEMQEPLRRIASFSEIIGEHIADGELEDAALIAEKLISSSTDLRNRFAHAVDEVDNRNRRRAVDDNLAFLKNAPPKDEHGEVS